MISQRISRGNSGDSFDDAIMVDGYQGKDDKWKQNVKESILVTGNRERYGYSSSTITCNGPGKLKTTDIFKIHSTTKSTIMSSINVRSANK